MARSKPKHVVPSLRARARPMWFEGLSPRDLNHVLSLIDMRMDSTRISRAEAMSYRPSSSGFLPSSSFSSQTNSTRVHEQCPTPAPIWKAKNVDGDPDGERAPDDANVIQIPEDKTQATSTKPDVDQSNEPLLAYWRREEPSTKQICICQECPRTFERPSKIPTHYWHRHVKHGMLSSLSNAEQARREVRAGALIDVITFNEELFRCTPAYSTPLIESSDVQVLSEAFSFLSIIKKPSNTDPSARDHALIACMKTVDAVIATRASDRAAYYDGA